jgi:hypothetical protein
MLKLLQRFEQHWLHNVRLLLLLLHLLLLEGLLLQLPSLTSLTCCSLPCCIHRCRGCCQCCLAVAADGCSRPPACCCGGLVCCGLLGLLPLVLLKQHLPCSADGDTHLPKAAASKHTTAQHRLRQE